MRKIAAFACLAAVLTISCIFGTRDAEPPVDTPGGGCTLESSEKAFLCMTSAISRQQDGDYERSLSADFVFSPTPTDSQDTAFQGVDVYAGWNKDVEMDVLGLLLGDADTTVVDFGTPTPLINKSTFVRYSVTYSLHVVPAPTGAGTEYEGVAEIDVRNEGGNWRVTFWNEVETVEGARTWGYLRGIIRLPLVP